MSAENPASSRSSPGRAALLSRRCCRLGQPVPRLAVATGARRRSRCLIARS
jgi:hypothetical protein